MSPLFEVTATAIDGVQVIKRTVIDDHRGSFERMFCAAELRDIVGERPIAQINRSVTAKRGTIRGMHFQHPPHGEIKIVSCARGRVFDVAVDLRRGSRTFLRWHGEVLEPGSHTMLVIPLGFAHGFQTLTGDCEMLYFSTEFYRPEAEGGIHPSDPRIGIHWPDPITELSVRDASHSMLASDFRGIDP